MNLDKIANKIANEYLKVAATATPWGEAQHATKYATGIVFYDTAGHGGLCVTKAAALKLLSKQALKAAAQLYNGAYWFEEDCDINVAFLELFSKIPTIQIKHPSLTIEKLERAVKQYHPQYFNLYINGKLSNAEKTLTFSDLQKGDILVYGNKSYTVAGNVISGKLGITDGYNTFYMSKNQFDDCAQIVRNGIILFSKEEAEVGQSSNLKPTIIINEYEDKTIFDPMECYRKVASILGKYTRANKIPYDIASNKNGVWMLKRDEQKGNKATILVLSGKGTIYVNSNYDYKEMISVTKLMDDVAQKYNYKLSSSKEIDSFVDDLIKIIL